ncbi:uncharacterized protein BDR25DRAFT_302638 [Lindgomyces ingoldianus]|uniref:Uncharacterized protein n=1 Tax=Lindgomyces ingoldianus TaxID=673940 RepID=A0ACB6R1S9_9PLEO|nr:uncharacterized protein BDR25DRAFT_302638 [Lindgomyces ingoldianus]KAF2472467.1 hypothetical protein BDR25DRAFT_302638 [Lindgomyces ingoldianus]
MNDQTSSTARIEDDTPPSPKRKKVRAKYAPKACVSCRRSKLKCSGENPCSRCVDGNRRCFYSEDQTAAEALQNLSRPTPVQPPINLNGNGNGVQRRSILPRNESMERRASDASLGGISMEARMARIEGMMEALIQERGGSGVSTRGSMEREDMAGDGFQSDAAFHAPMETFSANLASVRQQLGFMQEMPTYTETRSRPSVSAASPSGNTESLSSVRVGLRCLAFPSPADFQKYIDFFFADINLCLPCVNEAEFRARSEKMLISRIIHNSDISFLALNYIIFACSDVLVDTAPSSVNGKPAGWKWFQTADELVGKRKFCGRGDLSLIQFLVYEAFYLIHADKPNAAYNVIGLACRLCFQFGLHQQSCWGNCSPYAVHVRQLIFWTVYFTDRRIALSCGRPYGIRDLDIDVEQPSWIYDKELYPDQPLPEPNVSRSSNMYLTCMVSWAKLAGDVWDQVFAPGAARRGVDGENAAVLDARIKHWTEAVLPTIPLLPTDQPPEVRHLRQHVLVHTRLNHLRLLLRRRTMVRLKYDGSTGRLCGDLAIDIVQRIKAHTPEAKAPSSFRFHMTASLGSAILILATLLVRDLASIGLQDKQSAYADSFRDGVSILHDIAIYLQAARRVADDLKDIVHVVTAVLSQQQGQDGVITQNVIPLNIDDLFPYSTLDFAQQGGWGEYHGSLGMAGWNGTGGTGAAGGMDNQMTNLDSWDFELQPHSGGHGVPWI